MTILKLNKEKNKKQDQLFPIVYNGRWTYQDQRANLNIFRKVTTQDNLQRNSEMAPSWWMQDFESRKNSKKPLYLSKEKVVKPPIDIIDQKNLMFLSDREERDVLLDKKVRNKIMSSGDDKLKRF